MESFARTYLWPLAHWILYCRRDLAKYTRYAGYRRPPTSFLLSAKSGADWAYDRSLGRGLFAANIRLAVAALVVFLESGILSTLALRKFCPSLDFGVCGVKEFSAGKYQKVESRLKILSQFGSINMALHDEFLSDSFQCPLWQKRCSSAFIFNSRTLSRSDGAKGNYPIAAQNPGLR